MSLAIEKIIELYRTAGAARYGREAINQEQHALQCATLAQAAGAGAELVAAALLHDLGLLLNAGAFDEAAAAAFLAEPFAAEAVQLCHWDDHARSPTRITQGWAHFEPVLRRARLREPQGACA